MAAKKRSRKSTRANSKLRLCKNKKSLNGCGVLEPVVGAYFTTVFQVAKSRVAWGNYSQLLSWGTEPTLDPNDILSNASELFVERGATAIVFGETWLVAKSLNHSLLISIDNWSDETLILDLNKTSQLTIGSLYSKIEVFTQRNALDSRIYVTQQHPTPISGSEQREWTLVTSNSGKRGWELSEAGSPAMYLEASEPELLLHAFINAPDNTWALGVNDSEILSEIVRK